MKKTVILFALVLSLTGCLTNCSPHPDVVLTPQEMVKAKLTATAWKVKSVSVDGNDQTHVYENLKLQFTSTAFTSLDGEPVWPTSGTWSFTTTDGKTFTRNDGVTVNLEVTDTTLTLALMWSSTTLGGRQSSVSGQHVFSFVKV